MNTGIPYELLTQRIFQELVNQDQAHNIRVQHNVILQGKILPHQVDVYWEFRVADIKYATVVQAKDWRNAVNQGELLKFRQVLDDLPGQPRGVFVTKTGYQDGAKRYADANGIMLYELKDATSEDDPRKKIVLRMNAYIPLAHEPSVEQDREWVKQEKRRLGIPDSDKFECWLQPDDQGRVMLFNEHDVRIGTINDVLDSMHARDFQVREPEAHEHVFKQPVFARTNLSGFTRIKLHSIKAIIEVRKESRELVFIPDDFVEYVLKDVTGNNARKFTGEAKEIK